MVCLADVEPAGDRGSAAVAEDRAGFGHHRHHPRHDDRHHAGAVWKIPGADAVHRAGDRAADHARGHHRDFQPDLLHPDGRLDRLARQPRLHHHHAGAYYLFHGLRLDHRAGADVAGRSRDRGGGDGSGKPALAGAVRRDPAGHQPGHPVGLASGLHHLAGRCGHHLLHHRAGGDDAAAAHLVQGQAGGNARHQRAGNAYGADRRHRGRGGRHRDEPGRGAQAGR
ncbi:UNVERIFIED_CONTAM: hypothetical protein NCL1_16579 [Trichonephila clavipes]